VLGPGNVFGSLQAYLPSGAGRDGHLNKGIAGFHIRGNKWFRFVAEIDPRTDFFRKTPV
jgi:hypothetical protein